MLIPTLRSDLNGRPATVWYRAQMGRWCVVYHCKYYYVEVHGELHELERNYNKLDPNKWIYIGEL